MPHLQYRTPFLFLDNLPDKFEFICLVLLKPRYIKAFRQLNVQALCNFPCFCPYGLKQGKLLLHADHLISRAEYEQIQTQIARISSLEKQIEVLTEALRLSRQKRFGASSERTSEDAMEQLSLLFNEAEVNVDQAAEEENGSVAVAAHKRHKKHEYTLDHLPENVPVEVVEHRLPEEEN